jgi:Rad3-related DNA helicases
VRHHGTVARSRRARTVSSLVVIDKIPFPPPDDALASARKTDLDEQGDDGFHLVFVATAATSLAQAAGRLIRTSSDKGVVAILDPRLRTKRYGTTLTGSLPPFHPSNDPDAVTAALTRLTGQPPLTPSTRPRKPGKKTTPRKKNSPTRSNRSGSAPAPSRGGSRAGSGKKTSPTRKRIPPKKRP